MLACALWLAACGGGGGGGDGDGDARFAVSGTVEGLAGSLVLRDGARQATVTSNGRFQLDDVPAGTSYDIVVQQQPQGQTCSVRNGRGTVQAAVTDIAVVCSTTIFVVGGKVEGASGALLLRLSNGSLLELGPNGAFSFPAPYGTAWTVTVETPPAGQGCSVANGSGTATADFDGVRVQCTDNAVRIGGTVQGLSGTVTLQLNGAELLPVTANGSFTFATPLAAGASYQVEVQAQPAAQVCTLAGARGVAGAAGESLQVACNGGTGTPPPPPPPPPALPIPSAPAQLTLTYGPKTLVFAWSATASATAYQLLEDPDGAGPLPLAPVGSGLAAATRSHVVAQLLTSRLNAQYAVQACNASGCGAASAAVAPDWARAIGYFKSSNPGANQFLGAVNTVSLSADGTTMALGAYGEASDGSSAANTSAPDAGAVYIYARGATGWVQQAYLKAPVPEAGDFFGKALALSADGNTLAVSADGEDSSHTGTFAVTPAHNNGNTESGAVYLYTRSGGAWSPQAFIKASNAGAFDLFGFSLALSGDGNTLAVGAYLEDSPARGINGATGDDPAGSESGAAYIFTRSGTTWSQQAFIKASNADANDWFGFKVALSFNGDTLAVSAWSETSASQATPADNSVLNAGAVYVFARTGAAWAEQAYLKSTFPEVEDRFGNALALSSDGNTLAVAAQGDDSNHTGTFAATPADNNLAANSGAVYVFARSGAAWSQQAFVKASNTRAVDRFGHQLSLAGDASLLAVGAYQEDSSARGFGGNQADAGATNAGAAYLFSRSGTNWTQQAYLKAPNADAGDRFGIGIALSRDGTSLAIAADGEDSGATGVQGNSADNGTSSAGAAYLY